MSDHDRDQHHHSHHHDSEGHSHGRDDSGGLAFTEKLEKMLVHWIRHNTDHVATYREWAQRTKEEGLPEIADYLLKAADGSDALNEIFEKASDLLKKV